MPLYLPPLKPQADLANIARANAELSTTLYDQANQNQNVNLANDIKAKVNEVLAVLRAAGIIK